MAQERLSYQFTSWLFLKFLGLIYLTAFLSLYVQITGLIGEKGILPCQNLLKVVASHDGSHHFLWLPTLAWFNASDFFLKCLCGGGVILSIFVVLGITRSLALFLLWIFYLSLTTIGGDFLSFQWDALLLETGFLAIFLFPWECRIRKSFELSQPSFMVIFLFRCLLFKLMFSSGMAKLYSGDLVWKDLTALYYHYETQPLPTWIGWYAHQLPHWIQRLSVGIMFCIELFTPFLIFAPRYLRFVGFFCLLFLQMLIMLTGNYAFFNWLTIAFCLLLLDDAFLSKFIPSFIAHLFSPITSESKKLTFRNLCILSVSIVVLFSSGVQMDRFLKKPIELPPTFYGIPIKKILIYTRVFHIVNSYGLFAVMTKERNELVIEGSLDKTHWLPYEFKYKPDNLMKRPSFIAPHQPRLDWQMWFLPFQPLSESVWLKQLLLRLLEGSPPVLSLFQKDPFPSSPPKYIRISVYQYTFTDMDTHRKTGAWWQRIYKGTYPFNI